MPEIDDAQFQQFQNLDAFTRRALQNPKTRRKLLEIQKTLNPDTAIPELDESDPIREDIKSLRTEIAAEKEARLKAENDRVEAAALAETRQKWSDGQALARKKGYEEEGLKKLEAFMEQHGIANHEHAIPFFEKVNPPPIPGSNSGNRWDFFGQQGPQGPDLKPLFEGREDQFLDKTIADTLNEVRSGG